MYAASFLFDTIPSASTRSGDPCNGTRRSCGVTLDVTSWRWDTPFTQLSTFISLNQVVHE